MTTIYIPRHMGARPELEIGKLVGETKLHRPWLPDWYRRFLQAPVIKPDYKLADVLYPSAGNEDTEPRHSTLSGN